MKSCSVLSYFLSVCFTVTSFSDPELQTIPYKKDGDLIIGGLFRVHEYSPYQFCSSKIRGPKSFQYYESMVHAIDTLNSYSHILPNITLGFVILDDCNKDQAALVRAMSFLPQEDCCNCSKDDSGYKFDVVGVISGSNSQNTIAAASLLSVFKIPVIGAVSTSDLLSDRTKFSHFLRVVPPDPYQATAMVDLLILHGWSYVSLVYSDGSYGEMGAKAVQVLAQERGICIAFSHEIDRSKGKEEYNYIAQELYQFKNARVVILFVQGTDGRALINAVKEMDIVNHFIWITSDSVGVANDLVGLEKYAAGSLFVQLYSTGMPSFTEYFESLNLNSSKNPWLPELWQREFDCKDKCYTTDSYTISNMPNYRQYNKTGLFLDTVQTFATGLHNYIVDNCPEAFLNKNLLRTCINRELLFPYLQNVTFEGSYGTVRFDSNGNADGKYQIDQLQYEGSDYTIKSVAIWDKMTGTLQGVQPRMWSHLPEIQHGVKQTPESICSYPCKPGEFYIQLELKCCWECRKCRDNEIVTSNYSSCELCPLHHWPDQSYFLYCESIPPTYMFYDDIIAILFLVLILVGLIVCVLVMVVFLQNKKNKLIKATSLQLSTLSLVGVISGYFTAILLLAEPNNGVCLVSRLGFNLGFAIAYSPLLAKTSRIYRIFASGKKGSKKIPFISSRSQLVLSAVLITLQIAISVCVVIMFPPQASLHMPISTMKYTELLCDLPLEGLIPPLAYNFVLILLCSYFAFKARTLPDNFNESRYIFGCVCTTTFLWSAFLPTYFAAFYAYYKVMLLALLLILNSSVMLLCLYIPRVYAVYYVEETTMRIVSTIGIAPGPSTIATTMN